MRCQQKPVRSAYHWTGSVFRWRNRALARPVGRPRKGAAKRPVARNFRMAYVGTVTLHDEQGTGGHTIRYGCMPEGDVIGLRDRMGADVAVLRSKRPHLKLHPLSAPPPPLLHR